MDTNSRPKPAFNKSADVRAAWRERQKAALQERERTEYEAIAARAAQRRREAERSFWARREEAVEREKSRLLLERPGAALRMLPSVRLRESLAYYRAADLVRRAHAHDLEMIERQREEEEDRFLRAQEEKRERAAREMADEFRARSTGQFHAALKARSAQRERDRGRDDDGRER